MKNIFLSLALAAGLVSFAGNADAQNTGKSFTNTGVVWTYTIDVSGMYQLTGFGGSGQSAIGGPLGLGKGNANPGIGGLGAGISGTLDLMAGTTLDIVIGVGFTDTRGNNNAGSGGGGTFVYTTIGSNSTPIFIVGGGGGADTLC